VLGMTGQLKTFLDHMGYRWLPHRPHPQMFRKIGLAVSTAAGAGAKKVPIYGGTSFTGEYPKVTAMPKI
ncbi:MAG TPA: NAD(P)H-dependent oxidoreductase, partial [Capillibacterium sp.]